MRSRILFIATGVLLLFAQSINATPLKDPYHSLHEAWIKKPDGTRDWSDEWTKQEYNRARDYMQVHTAELMRVSGQAAEDIEQIQRIRSGVDRAVDIVSIAVTAIQSANNIYNLAQSPEIHFNNQVLKKSSELKSTLAKMSDLDLGMLNQKLADYYKVVDTIRNTDDFIMAVSASMVLYETYEQVAPDSELSQIKSYVFDRLSSTNEASVLEGLFRITDPSLDETGAAVTALMMISSEMRSSLFSPANWQVVAGKAVFSASLKPAFLVTNTVKIVNNLAAAKTITEVVIEQSNSMMLALEFLNYYYLGYKGNREEFETALGRGAGEFWTLSDTFDAFLSASTGGMSFKERYKLDWLSLVISMGANTRQQALEMIERVIRDAPVLFARPEAVLVSFEVSPSAREGNIVMVGDVYQVNFVGESYLTDFPYTFVTNIMPAETSASVVSEGHGRYRVISAGYFQVAFEVQYLKQDGSWGILPPIKMADVAYSPFDSVVFHSPTISSIAPRNTSTFEIDLNVPSHIVTGSGLSVALSAEHSVEIFLRSQLTGKIVGSGKAVHGGPFRLIIQLPYDETKLVYNGGAVGVDIEYMATTPPLIYRKTQAAGEIVALIKQVDEFVLDTTTVDMSSVGVISYQFQSGHSVGFDSYYNIFDFSAPEVLRLCLSNVEEFHDTEDKEVWLATQYYAAGDVGPVYRQIPGTIADDCFEFTFSVPGRYQLMNFVERPSDNPTGQVFSFPLYHYYSQVSGANSVTTPPGDGSGDPDPGMPLTRQLNDTGITFCGEASVGNNFPCTGNEPAGQDAHYGRDAAAAAGAEGIAANAKGFSFTKIANNGNPLPASATLGSGPNDWACTRDNVTGLIWEVKVNNSSHLRHQSHGYTWYNTHSPYGGPGVVGNTSSCNNTLGSNNCNTENYVTAVNSTNLCSASDWRMPSVHELQSIVDYGRSSPAINGDYFPNTPSSVVWSGSPYASSSDHAWNVSFDHGYAGLSYRFVNRQVRLVRGGQ